MVLTGIYIACGFMFQACSVLADFLLCLGVEWEIRCPKQMKVDHYKVFWNLGPDYSHAESSSYPSERLSKEMLVQCWSPP